MEKYEEFKNIKLEDTGLIRANHLDFVFTCMRKNNISTLQELFIKDDEKSIDYETTVGYAKHKNPINQIKGTISLLRYKYLNEDLPFIEIVNTKVYNGYVRLNGKTTEDGLIYYLTSVGLPYEFSYSLNRIAHENVNCGFTGKLIELLENYLIYGNGTVYCTRPEYENAITKIEIIIDWYKSLDTSYKKIETVEEARNLLHFLYEELDSLKTQKMDIDNKIHKTEKHIHYTDSVLRRLLKK